MAEEQKQLLEQITELIQGKSLDKLSVLLAEQRSSDISEIVEILDDEERRIIFDSLDRSVSAEVLEKVDEATRAELFELLGEQELSHLISELDPDDAADVLLELPEEDLEDVLELVSSEHAARIKDLMSYSEDSAGGIMDPEFVCVPEDATVKQAIDRIRAAEIDEDFFAVFVINKVGQFLGDIRIRSLITKPENTTIKNLIDTDTIYVHVDTDQEEVRNIFKKNDLIVVPVLDEEHKLVGRITADRIIEVAEEEAAEDMYFMAGTNPAELETFSIIHAARIRMTWLLPCLAGTGVTAIVGLLFKNIFSNSDMLAAYATIMTFVPMIAAISGNAGLQTSAIVVCGLATGDLAALKLGQVFAREVRIALFIAITCGILGGVLCGTLAHLIPSNVSAISDTINSATETSQSTPEAPINYLKIAIAFSIAMFSAILVATTLGLLLPFLFRHVGIDPAISSGPLVTTANDSISVTIYLALAMLLIG